MAKSRSSADKSLEVGIKFKSYTEDVKKDTVEMIDLMKSSVSTVSALANSAFSSVSDVTTKAANQLAQHKAATIQTAKETADAVGAIDEESFKEKQLLARAMIEHAKEVGKQWVEQTNIVRTQTAKHNEELARQNAERLAQAKANAEAIGAIDEATFQEKELRARAVLDRAKRQGQEYLDLLKTQQSQYDAVVKGSNEERKRAERETLAQQKAERERSRQEEKSAMRQHQQEERAVREQKRREEKDALDRERSEKISHLRAIVASSRTFDELEREYSRVKTKDLIHDIEHLQDLKAAKQSEASHATSQAAQDEANAWVKAYGEEIRSLNLLATRRKEVQHGGEGISIGKPGIFREIEHGSFGMGVLGGLAGGEAIEFGHRMFEEFKSIGDVVHDANQQIAGSVGKLGGSMRFTKEEMDRVHTSSVRIAEDWAMDRHEVEMLQAKFIGWSGLYGKKAEEMTNIALAASKELQRPASQVIEFLGKGTDPDMLQQLARIGIRIDKNATVQERYNAIVKQFKPGMVDAMAATHDAVGEFERMEEKVHAAKEELLDQAFRDITPTFQELFPAVQGVAKGFESVIHFVGNNIDVFKTLGIGIGVVTVALKGYSLAMAATPFGATIAGLTGLAALIAALRPNYHKLADSIEEANEVNKKFTEDMAKADEYSQTASHVRELITQYEDLKKRVKPDEQKKLAEVAGEIAKETHGAAVSIDEYGHALDVNIESVNNFADAEENLANKMRAATGLDLTRIGTELSKEISNANNEIKELDEKAQAPISDDIKQALAGYSDKKQMQAELDRQLAQQHGEAEKRASELTQQRIQAVQRLVDVSRNWVKMQKEVVTVEQLQNQFQIKDLELAKQIYALATKKAEDVKPPKTNNNKTLTNEEAFRAEESRLRGEEAKKLRILESSIHDEAQLNLQRLQLAVEIQRKIADAATRFRVRANEEALAYEDKKISLQKAVDNVSEDQAKKHLDNIAKAASLQELELDRQLAREPKREKEIAELRFNIQKKSLEDQIAFAELAGLDTKALFDRIEALTHEHELRLIRDQAESAKNLRAALDERLKIQLDFEKRSAEARQSGIDREIAQEQYKHNEIIEKLRLAKQKELDLEGNNEEKKQETNKTYQALERTENTLHHNTLLDILTRYYTQETVVGAAFFEGLKSFESQGLDWLEQRWMMSWKNQGTALYKATQTMLGVIKSFALKALDEAERSGAKFLVEKLFDIGSLFKSKKPDSNTNAEGSPVTTAAINTANALNDTALALKRFEAILNGFVHPDTFTDTESVVQSFRHGNILNQTRYAHAPIDEDFMQGGDLENGVGPQGTVLGDGSQIIDLGQRGIEQARRIDAERARAKLLADAKAMRAHTSTEPSPNGGGDLSSLFMQRYDVNADQFTKPQYLLSPEELAQRRREAMAGMASIPLMALSAGTGGLASAMFGTGIKAMASEVAMGTGLNVAANAALPDQYVDKHLLDRISIFSAPGTGMAGAGMFKGTSALVSHELEATSEVEAISASVIKRIFTKTAEIAEQAGAVEVGKEYAKGSAASIIGSHGVSAETGSADLVGASFFPPSSGRSLNGNFLAPTSYHTDSLHNILDSSGNNVGVPTELALQQAKFIAEKKAEIEQQTELENRKQLLAQSSQGIAQQQSQAGVMPLQASLSNAPLASQPDVQPASQHVAYGPPSQASSTDTAGDKDLQTGLSVAAGALTALGPLLSPKKKKQNPLLHGILGAASIGLSFIPGFGPALGGALGALGGAFGLADGGPVIGIGGPRDDKNVRLLSNKEFVLRASAVESLGLSNVDYINKTGKLPPLNIQDYKPAPLPAVSQPFTGGGNSSADIERHFDRLASRMESAFREQKLVYNNNPYDNRTAERQYVVAKKGARIG